MATRKVAAPGVGISSGGISSGISSGGISGGGVSVGAIGNAVKQWREFDLDKTRQSLDEEAIKVADQQESATGNRRKLAEATKSTK